MFRTSPSQRGNATRARGAGTSPCQRWWGWDFIAQQPPGSSRSSTDACSAQLSWFALQINLKKPNPAPKPLFPAPAELMRSSALQGWVWVSVPHRLLGQRDLGRFRSSPRARGCFGWRTRLPHLALGLMLITTAFG